MDSYILENCSTCRKIATIDLSIVFAEDSYFWLKLSEIFNVEKYLEEKDKTSL